MAISLKPTKGMSPKAAALAKRQNRGRKNITGTPTKPRLVVTRSARHIVAQVIDDTKGHTLVSASTMESDLRASKAGKTEKAKKVGELIASRAKDAGVDQVVFDRAGRQYHGRVAALADGAREAGLGL
ncbi:MAG: 50S ribosomal protein L18 [Propionibacteriaceae bacterium]|nr:50S ribosomal protein L18 [Propionibacteriaceae bacterium]